MKQEYNPNNKDILIFVGDRLYPREEAKVSVFDSSVQGGDAVWEGMRVYNGKVFAYEEHISRLLASAHSLAFENVPDEVFIREAIIKTLKANHMLTGTHIRLTLTRGIKITSGMDPRLNKSGCCLIVLAEWKSPVYEGLHLKLITSSLRRNSPSFLESGIHHNNLLNNILAKIQANVAGADDALMLDERGFVAETNATNIFMVKNGDLSTPLANACLPGITRKHVMQLAAENGIDCTEKNLSLGDFYNADEVFTTGSMGELAPVAEIDGRSIIDKKRAGVTTKLKVLYRTLTESRGLQINFDS